MSAPRNKREARLWVRRHWSDFIAYADMGGVADLKNDHLDAVWGDECLRVSKRIARKP